MPPVQQVPTRSPGKWNRAIPVLIAGLGARTYADAVGPTASSASSGSKPRAPYECHDTVITPHKQERREHFLVTEEDTLILRDTEYAISKDRYGYIKLTPAEGAAAE